jgi:hypothetical protein
MPYLDERVGEIRSLAGGSPNPRGCVSVINSTMKSALAMAEEAFGRRPSGRYGVETSPPTDEREEDEHARRPESHRIFEQGPQP